MTGVFYSNPSADYLGSFEIKPNFITYSTTWLLKKNLQLDLSSSLY